MSLKPIGHLLKKTYGEKTYDLLCKLTKHFNAVKLGSKCVKCGCSIKNFSKIHILCAGCSIGDLTYDSSNLWAVAQLVNTKRYYLCEEGKMYNGCTICGERCKEKLGYGLFPYTGLNHLGGEHDFREFIFCAPCYVLYNSSFIAKELRFENLGCKDYGYNFQRYTYSYQKQVEGLLLCINFIYGFSGVFLPNEIIQEIFDILWADYKFERRRDIKRILLKQKLKEQKIERQLERNKTKTFGKRIIKIHE